MSLSVKAVQGRNGRMSPVITDQQIEDSKLASTISFATDESYDISDIAQAPLFLRYMWTQ